MAAPLYPISGPSGPRIPAFQAQNQAPAAQALLETLAYGANAVARQVIQNEADAAAVEEGERGKLEGFKAGQAGSAPPAMDDLSGIGGGRYRQGAVVGYLAGASLHMRARFAEIAAEAKGDPARFEQLAQGVVKEFGDLPPALQAGVEGEAATLIAARKADLASEREAARKRDDALNVRSQLGVYEADMASAARAGHTAQLSDLRARHEALVRASVDGGLIGPEFGANALASASDEVEQQLAIGQIERTLADHGPGAARKEMDHALTLISDPRDADRLRRTVEAPIAAEEARIREMQTRQEVLAYVRAAGAFSQQAQATIERIKTEKDIGREETLGEAAQQLRDLEDQLIKDSGLSGKAQYTLRLDLEKQRMAYGSELGKMALTRQHQMVNEALGGEIKTLTAQALRSPDQLTPLFRQLDEKIDTLAPGLTPEEEASARDLGRRELALNAIDGHLMRGNADGARDIIDSAPGILASLPPGDQRRILGALNEADVAKMQAARARDERLSRAEYINGAPLTLSQRIKLDSQPLPAEGNALAANVTQLEDVLGPLDEDKRKRARSVFEPGKPLTDLGKTMADREAFIAQYGANSEQVRAFDEASRKSATSDPKLSDVAEIRREFTGNSKDFVAIRDAFSRIAATARDPSPAGDLALMFNYMKMLDPNSVVRESEFAQVAATGSWGEQLRGAALRFLNGERLTESQRQDFLSRSEDLMRSSARSQIYLEEQFRNIADKAGLPADQVVIDFVGRYRDAIGASATAGSSGGGAAKTPAASEKSTAPKPEKKLIRLDLEGNVIQGGGGG